ncbi:hypothetical protein G5B46_12845 [Caulobacter sp. 602-2]|uniref:Hedgehog/Intein (Hint) domain-containing protein n=1 Tax=Caulobacter sp. 602-2 TaxID=2710887 RepID=A0A6G4QZY8_9CAUL|nr:hypothetical protein [Caulobacter sp. 602-2]NGM50498.1 hypothetical protein [Caulobacter sp. 602-2]
MLVNGTQIAISATETKAIEDLQVGDTVWAAGLSRDWKATAVKYSSGTGRGAASPAVLCKVGGDRELICARNQWVLTTRGLLTIDRLTPDDKLIQADGQTADIIALTIGMLQLGESAIATSPMATTDPEGHLILAQGFMVADYALNMGLSLAHQEAPVVGVSD